MRRTDVEKWIEDNGGQKGQAVITYTERPNPKYKKGVDERQTVPVKQVTWTANNGQTLSVIDPGNHPTTDKEIAERDPGGMKNDPNTGADFYDPDYEVVGGGPKESKESPVPGRTPEQERDDKRIIAEKEKNLNDPASGRWESDAERKQREDKDADRARQQQIDAQNNANEQTRIGISQQAESRAQAAQQAQDQRAAESAARDKERLDLERERYTFERDKSNRPTVLGTPTEDQENIALFDPTTGEVKSQTNPLYNAAKAEAKRLQEELATAIQMNKLNAEQAAAIYTQWFKEHVEVPFMMASERRAQAAEERAVLEARERKVQFKATNDIARANVGQQAASTAVNAEISMLPHRVGPKYGEQMSSAINSLAAGGTLNGPSASAGIHFTADAFEYEAPDIKKIAKQATKAALKGITPYDPDSTPDGPAASYEGINMPSVDVMAGAPQAPNYIDTNSMYQNWVNNRYTGPNR